MDAVFAGDGGGDFAAEEFFGGLDFERRERHLGGIAHFGLDQGRGEIGEMPVRLADGGAGVMREFLDVGMGDGGVFDGQRVAVAVESAEVGELVQLFGEPAAGRRGDDQFDAGPHHVVDQAFFADDAGVVAQVDRLFGLPDVLLQVEVAQAVGEADVGEAFEVAMSPHDDRHGGRRSGDDVERHLGFQAAGLAFPEAGQGDFGGIGARPQGGVDQQGQRGLGVGLDGEEGEVIAGVVDGDGAFDLGDGLGGAVVDVEADGLVGFKAVEHGAFRSEAEGHRAGLEGDDAPGDAHLVQEAGEGVEVAAEAVADGEAVAAVGDGLAAGEGFIQEQFAVAEKGDLAVGVIGEGEMIPGVGGEGQIRG